LTYRSEVLPAGRLNQPDVQALCRRSPTLEAASCISRACVALTLKTSGDSKG
jgi:hypothetical protein